MTLQDVRQDVKRAESPQQQLDAGIRGFADLVAAGRYAEAGFVADQTFEYARRARQPSASARPSSPAR